MAAHRRHKKHHHEEHENHERWLVSGFDMMTLMFAVFVILFAISSVNVSKVHLLQQSLLEAGITCALREGAIRISPHFYNTVEDVDRLIDVLDSTLQ